MLPPISRSRESLWVWIFWALVIYLALELSVFFIAALVLNKTVTELTGPYLAIAIPWMVFAPIIWWLRKFEERVSSTRLARLWGLSMALFGGAEIVAIVYSGVALRFMTLNYELIAPILVLLPSLPILYFVMYHQALKHIGAREAMKQSGHSPK
jgi:hypothetical protein